MRLTASVSRLLVLAVLLASPAAAQVGPDSALRDAVRLEQPGHRKAADVVSTILVGVSLARPCLQDRTWRCAGNEAVQVGIAIGSAEIVKRLVHRERPGHQDNLSFFSEHTELACLGTVRSKTWALCPAVGYLRMASDWHWSTDVATGAAVGALLTTVRF